MHARVAEIKRDHTRNCVTLPQIQLRTVREERTKRTGVDAPGEDDQVAPLGGKKGLGQCEISGRRGVRVRKICTKLRRRIHLASQVPRRLYVGGEPAVA